MPPTRVRKRYDSRTPTLYWHKRRAKWYIVFYHPATRRRQWKTTDTADRIEAERKLAEQIKWLGAAELGLIEIATTQQAQTTVNQCLDLWVEEQHRRTPPGKRIPALSQLKACRAALGAHRVSALTLGLLNATMDAWRTQGYANATINHRLTYVRSACALGQAHHLIRAIPTFTIIGKGGVKHGWPSFSEKDNVREGLVTPEELARTCAAESEPAYRDLYVFAFWTGMRWGGICGLRWAGFDPHTFSLRLHPRASKTKKPVVLRLRPGTQLHALIARRWATRSPGATWIFELAGQHLAAGYSRWARAWQRAGLEMVPGKRSQHGRLVPAQVFHDLRRTGLTNLINSGVRESVAMLISGHTTTSVFRRYVIGGEAETEAALAAVSAQIGPVPEFAPLTLSVKRASHLGQRTRWGVRRDPQAAGLRRGRTHPAPAPTPATLVHASA